MKKIILVLITAIFITGCSTVERDFVSEVQKMGNAKKVEGQIKIETEIGKILETIKGESSEKISDINYNLDEKVELILEHKTNKEENQMELDIYAKNETQNVKLTKIYVDNNKLYFDKIKLLESLKELKYVDDELYKELKKEIDLKYPTDKKYVQTKYENNNLDSNTNVEFEESFLQMFSNYETNLIAKEGNKYVFEVDGKKLTDQLVESIKYIYNNLDNIKKNVKEISTQISPEDVSQKQQIDEFFVEMENNKEQVLTSLEMYISMIKLQIDLEKTFSLRYTLEKESENKYINEINIDFNYNEFAKLMGVVSESKKENIFELNIYSETKIIEDEMIIDIPKENIYIKEKVNFKDKDKFKEDSSREAVNNMVNRGIISGYPDNSFRPHNKVTREEFAVMIIKANKLKDGKNLKSTFKDLENNRWSKNYLMLLKSKKILKGDQNGNINPTKTITLGELSTILNRVYDYQLENPTLGYKKTGHWADKDIEKLHKSLLLDNITYTNITTENIEYNPEHEVTRLECVKILNGLLKIGNSKL